MSDPFLQQWYHVRETSHDAVVLPDGCRDLIVNTGSDGRSALEYSEIDDRVRNVHLAGGDRLTGFRLHPGATFSPKVLQQLRADVTFGLSHDEMAARVRDAIHLHVQRNDEPIAAILATTSVGAAARWLGVTPRTLHRTLVKLTGRSPAFWLDLARARRALSALAGSAPLAEIAFLAGYADQAHMTRSFRSRFGSTPARFRADAGLMRLAAQQGFAG